MPEERYQGSGRGGSGKAEFVGGVAADAVL
jgi:hypothetical protein